MEVSVEPAGGLVLVDEVLREMDLSSKIDAHYPTHHNWKGISMGEVVHFWIGYIITYNDHRLSKVESWASTVFESIFNLCNSADQLSIKNFTDDKLGNVLRDFSYQEQWQGFERDVNKNLVSVYELPSNQVNLDATIGQSFREVFLESLFQIGHSKQFRDNLPQFKLMLASLLGADIPLASLTVSGEKADDRLYLPVIEEVQESLSKTGLLYVGDSKFGSREIRSHLDQTSNYYFCPLSKVQLPNKVLRQYLNNLGAVTPLFSEDRLIGKVSECMSNCSYETYQWEERHLIVYTELQAKQQKKGLATRLLSSKEALEELNNFKKGKRKIRSETALRQKIAAILKKHRVQNLLVVNIESHIEKKKIRAHKDKPARVEDIFTYKVKVTENEEGLRDAQQVLGWRVYATNQNFQDFQAENVLELYKSELGIERRFNDLKNKVCHLIPVFLKLEKHILGLINLLLLVLKVISIVEYKMAKKLQERKTELAGMYAGNPKITTPKPTITKIMEAMHSINIVIIKHNGKVLQAIVTQINDVQTQILDLLGIRLNIYQDLAESIQIFNSD